MANGHGRLIHADGDVYVGQWKDDKLNGVALKEYTSDEISFGTWKDDKLVDAKTISSEEK